MKLVIYGLILLSFKLSFAQDISINSQTFNGWSIAEKKEKLFELFKAEVPPDTSLILFFKTLFEEGLDPSLRSKNGKESLFDACLRTERFGTAQFIVMSDYDPNNRCFECNGETALHKAVTKSDQLNGSSPEIGELILFLLKNGADPDLRDMKTRTPLHLAIINKDSVAFMTFMNEDVKFNHQLTDTKGNGYLIFFDKKWGDDYFREILMRKTNLKYPPTRAQIKEKNKQ